MREVTTDSSTVRIDKWLWAARFFKTRSTAAQAVVGGKVHVNGERVKPARILKLGDSLEITRGEERFVVLVQALSEKRGSAKIAQSLFAETEQSIASRTTNREEKRFEKMSRPAPPSRPDKRARREIRQFSGKK